MSIFGKKNKNLFKLIIALKSSSIDVQLVKIPKEQGKREVLLFSRNVMLLQSSRDSVVYTRQYIVELQKILEKHKFEIQKHVATDFFEINLVLYSPWFTSKIESIYHENPVVITDAFLSQKINKIKTDPNLHAIEKRIIKVEVNGYPLTNFVKTKYSHIKLDLYTSHISETLLEIFKKTIKISFPHTKEIHMYTSPFLFLDRIKEYLVQEDNVTVLYISGEITELSIIKDDSLVYFATFPIGKHDFLRSIQDNIKTYDFELLQEKHLQIKSKKHVSHLNEIKKEWAQSICDLMHHFKEHVPSKVLIMTDSSTRIFFTELLTASIIQNPNSVLKNHRIINFDISLLKDIISYKTPFGDTEIDSILEALI